MPNVLTEADVTWALNHLNNFGDTDLFPRPFELSLMLTEKAKVVAYVRGSTLRSTSGMSHGERSSSRTN